HKEKAKLPEKLAFPVYLIPFLGKAGVQTVRARERDVLLDFNCGHIWQPLSVKAQKGFPIAMVESLITDGKKYPERFRLHAHKLGSVVGRFSAYLGSAKKEDWTMTVRAEQGARYVVFESLVQQARFREQIAVEESVREAFSLDWPLDILVPIFEYLAKDRETVLSVRFGKKTPYLLDAGAIQLVVSRRK